MPKFTNAERELVKNIVAIFTIKRMSDLDINDEISRQTNKTVSKQELWNIRQRIKKDSYYWYKQLREGEYEYIHEFKERINEIFWLQKKHHEIIDSPVESTSNKQASLVELHRLNVTLSNYFDVAPFIINGITISNTQQDQAATRAAAPEQQERNFIV